MIFIQHDGPPGDPHHPDEPGWRLLPTLEIKPDDTVVHKTSCDAFLHTTLDDVLRETGIDRLIITGCATDYCVDTTVRSALARGWPTIVPSDGHTTVDRPHLSATQIIAHHNAIWADFLAPKGPARVCLCTEVRVIHLTAQLERLAGPPHAWLKQRFSDKETRGRAEVAPLARHRRSVA